MYQIIGMFVGRKRPTVARRQVFEHLDSWAGGASQGSNSQLRSENIVQVLLLGSVIVTFTNHLHSEQVSIEMQTGFGIGYSDCSVVNSQEKPVGCAMPFLRTFAWGELENLQWMLVGILKVKRPDPAGILVPIGQPLRGGRSVFDFILPQPLVGLIHIADDDGDVLEPEVVAAGINRHGAALGSKVLDQLDALVSQFQPYHPHAQTKHTF